MTTVPPMLWLDPSVALPAWLVAGIGRVAVEWSALEWQCEDAIRSLLQTDVKRGRIAVTGMNMRSRVTCLTNLLQAFKLTRLRETFVKLGDEITQKREGERNKVVHGLWARVEGEWYVIRTSGARELLLSGKVSRAVLPQREKVTLHEIAAIRDQSGRYARR